MLGREKRKQAEDTTPAREQVIEVTASMQGSLTFRDPVNLRISGRFEGSLETLGRLTIGERAQVQAQITGEFITIAGQVSGKLVARRQLRVTGSGRITGEVWTPSLLVEEGAVLDGMCHMAEAARGAQTETLSVEEVAQYLEVEPAIVQQWAIQGRIPAIRDGEQWVFDRARLDQWVANERSERSRQRESE